MGTMTYLKSVELFGKQKWVGSLKRWPSAFVPDVFRFFAFPIFFLENREENQQKKVNTLDGNVKAVGV